MGKYVIKRSKLGAVLWFTPEDGQVECLGVFPSTGVARAIVKGRRKREVAARVQRFLGCVK
jgi:hypothetical protein